MDLSLKQIQYFIATAEAGKVSVAAANLNLSQSAVTAAIKSLETVLDRKLFQRHSNGVSLTYDGHQFLDHARNIAAVVSEATRAARRSGRGISGRIDVGVTYTVAGYFLPPLLSRFRRLFPDVEVSLHELDRKEIERRLVGGGLDAAVLLVSNLENREELQSELLIRSRRRLWLSTNHELTRREHVGLADVARYPYLMLTVDEAEHSAIRYWMETSFRPSIVFRSSSVEAIRSMVATGMGITILSDMVYRPWSLEGQRIDVRNLDSHVHTMDVGLAWRRGSERSPATRAFCEALAMSFSSTLPHYQD